MNWYFKKSRWLGEHPAAARLVISLNRGLTVLVYLWYSLLCALMALNLIQGQTELLPRLLRVVLVPALTFAGGSLLRAELNRPRPYEVMNLPPLTPKETKGKSFPSRHVFCAAVISTAFLWCDTTLGLLFIAIAVLLAACRVLVGVHWLRDVLAGLALGWLCGLAGFWLIP